MKLFENLRRYIIELAKKEGKRIDGRKFDEYRDIKIEYGVSKNAEGSAKVTLGKTVVVAGVKMEIGEPFPDNPDEGILIVGAEFSPIASPDFEPGPPNEYAIELARVVDRGIRESGAIDTKKLCITEGEKVWMIFIDIYVMNHDGNLIDASALAAMAALLDAKFPKVDEEGNVDYHEHTDQKVPIVKVPIAVTIAKIGDFLMVDPGKKEEEVMDARITITSTDVINGVQKGGSMGLTQDELDQCIDLAFEKAKELRMNVFGDKI